jgi:hypothetical protein
LAELLTEHCRIIGIAEVTRRGGGSDDQTVCRGRLT